MLLQMYSDVKSHPHTPIHAQQGEVLCIEADVGCPVWLWCYEQELTPSEILSTDHNPAD